MLTEYELNCLRAVIHMAKRNRDYKNSVNGFPCYFLVDGSLTNKIEYQKAVQVVWELYIKLKYPKE